MLDIRNVSPEIIQVTRLNNTIKLVKAGMVYEMSPYRLIRYSLVFTFTPIVDTIRNNQYPGK